MRDFLSRTFEILWSITKILIIIAIIAIAIFIITWFLYLKNSFIDFWKGYFSDMFGGWSFFTPFKECLHDIVDKLFD